MRFLGFLLVFLIGGVVGFFVGTLGGASAGALATVCEIVETGVADGSLTQDEANRLLGAQIDKLNLGDQRAAVIEQAKKIAKPGPCLTAFDAAGAASPAPPPATP